MTRPMVLIIDADAQSRMTLTHAFNHNGCSVDTAANGIDGLQKMRQGDYRLLIAGTPLKGLATGALLKDVNQHAPRLPAVITAANADAAEAVKSIQMGAAEYLVKPIDGLHIETLVAKYVQDRSLSQHIPRAEIQPSKAKNADEIITGDKEVLGLIDLAGRIASSLATVLIQGESGTGKEVLARFIHRQGARADQPYVAVNCAALPETLAESELFGHEKGAFTGAFARNLGKFELAHGGTLVLDEISELPLALQAKLLRALQEKQIDRVGGNRPVDIDVRVIAISNLNLKTAVAQGTFRQDLFYRINVVPFNLPALRQRPGDSILLAEHFAAKFATLNGSNPMSLSAATMQMIQNYAWPGNVRELQNAIERAVLICPSSTIEPKDLCLEATEITERADTGLMAGMTVKQMEQRLIENTLKELNGNRTHAARMLGISIRTLRNKLNEYKQRQEAVSSNV